MNGSSKDPYIEQAAIQIATDNKWRAVAFNYGKVSVVPKSHHNKSTQTIFINKKETGSDEASKSNGDNDTNENTNENMGFTYIATIGGIVGGLLVVCSVIYLVIGHKKSKPDHGPQNNRKDFQGRVENENNKKIIMKF